MVYTECAEMAAVLSSTSHVRTNSAATTPLGWIFKVCCKKSYSHSFSVTCNKSAVSLLESGEFYIKRSTTPTQATDLQIGKTKLNLSVQTPRSHEGRVQGVRAVGGHQNFDVSTRVKPVQLIDQFQHGPLDLVVPTGSIIKPGTWRGVEKKVQQVNAPSMTVFTS